MGKGKLNAFVFSRGLGVDLPVWGLSTGSKWSTSIPAPGFIREYIRMMIQRAKIVVIRS